MTTTHESIKTWERPPAPLEMLLIIQKTKFVQVNLQLEDVMLWSNLDFDL